MMLCFVLFCFVLFFLPLCIEMKKGNFQGSPIYHRTHSSWRLRSLEFQSEKNDSIKGFKIGDLE